MSVLAQLAKGFNTNPGGAFIEARDRRQAIDQQAQSQSIVDMLRREQITGMQTDRRLAEQSAMAQAEQQRRAQAELLMWGETLAQAVPSLGLPPEQAQTFTQALTSREPGTVARAAQIVQPLIGKAKPERKTAKASDGTLRYVDSGERVFPEVEASERDRLAEQIDRERLRGLRQQNEQGPKPATVSESQAKAQAFLVTMRRASEDMGRITGGGFDPDSRTARIQNAILPNELGNTELKLYDQAARAWANASLRFESGGAITPQEIEERARTYFPQPGDGPLVIEQKARARKAIEDGIRLAAERGASTETKADFRWNPDTGQLEPI